MEYKKNKQLRLISETSRYARKGASLIILIFSLFAILGLSALVVDLGVILNQRYELQKAVESAALIAAAEYEVYFTDREVAGDERLGLPYDTKITDPATGVVSVQYRALKEYNQMLGLGTVDAVPTITFNHNSRAVMVEANASARTYFIALLGINKVEFNARAAAVAIPAYLSSRYPRPTGSIIQGVNTAADPGPDYSDTEIREPLGGDTSGEIIPTGTVYNINSDINNIYGPRDARSVSLGPGGHITIKLPQTIYDGKGADFVIYETGHAEGYFVFAGIDVDPANPYIDAKETPDPDASGNELIRWINISCTGIPLYAKLDDSELIGAHRTQVLINGGIVDEYKFYGSGYFDLGIRCDNAVDGTIYDGTDPTNSYQIKNIKYLKIIDDNIEDGFLLQPHMSDGAPTEYYHPRGMPMVIPGEHSSMTPGADIDAVEILHHSRLISIAEFSVDTDNDFLIDVVERMHGLDPNNPDTDGDGLEDICELEGMEPGHGYVDFAHRMSATPQGEGTKTLPSDDDLSSIIKNYPTNADTYPPLMEIEIP